MENGLSGCGEWIEWMWKVDWVDVESGAAPDLTLIQQFVELECVAVCARLSLY